MKLTFTPLLLCVTILMFSCTEDSKEEIHKKRQKEAQKESYIQETVKHPVFEKDTTLAGAKKNLVEFEKGKVEDTKIFENGLKIKWLEKGAGQKVNIGDMIFIEYRVALEDGKIIDGNNRKNLPGIPFIVGYNMQTPGWDLAFPNLNLGDFVKIELPAALAYGEKGIGDIVPPNSNIWLYVRLLSAVAPGMNEDGIKSWKILEGDKALNVEEKEVTFHTIVSTESRPAVMNTYLSNFPVKYVVGQKTVVPGLRRILNNARSGDRYLVLLNSNQAYGPKGYANLIKPKETVLFNVEVVNVRSMN
jgi:FKBP-type peptidyl-prolyl cis-trans isomerase